PVLPGEGGCYSRRPFAFWRMREPGINRHPWERRPRREYGCANSRRDAAPTTASPQRGSRFHVEPALVALRPPLHRRAVVLRLAADVEAVRVEDGLDGAELIAGDVCVGTLPAQQVEQQRGDQRTVHDEARIAFHLGDVAPVVVDAVAVEGERRIAE